MNKTTLMRGLVAASTLVLAQFACAHAYPRHQSPEAGATVSPAPHEVSIEFDDALEPAFSSITVTDGQGKPVNSGKSAVDAGNKKLMKVALASLAPGSYTVAWVAVADDGHRTQGHYTFTVK
ncbi:copper resistance CopC family protein [Caballeronia telluris]|uniref:Copper resistance protein CopC n=1 Tax=Caballeronia telluris TaxID=326475 RepID=A0A158K0I6_9BURK|nr:copper resistance protein CopC [Caballeronia telluris]SAL74209.1 copper resistance protein CopC [Caballeronia telluris]